MTTETLEAGLRAAVGPECIRPCTPSDAIDGVLPLCVVAPTHVDAASRVLALCSSTGTAVIPRGRGTRLSLGMPPSRSAVILSMERMHRVLEYAPGDLVLRVEAGARLDTLQALLAQEGQMLALDPMCGPGTVGGVVATRDSGPLRLRFGAVRDMLIGLTYVLADGTSARSGGKVVKNVAGYDLCKLFTGSLGTLGLITELTFRLHPRPVAATTLVAAVPPGLDAQIPVDSLLRSTLVPSRLSLLRADSDTRLVVEFSGVPPGVEAQMETARRILASSGVRSTSSSAGTAIWDTPRDLSSAPVVLRQFVPPAHTLTCAQAIERSARAAGGSARLWLDPGVGAVLAALQGGEDAAAAALRSLRRGPYGANLVLWRAPFGVKTQVGVWGESPAFPLMRRIKAQFDPANIMNPGRYIGGL